MDMKEKVNAVIERVRPALEADGGGIELVDILEDEKAVVVSVLGQRYSFLR